MMRPEQIKKFCPCCCFLCWAQYQNNINHLFKYLFFYILSPNQRNIPCSQGYAVILSFAQLSILAIASLFPFHHYFFIFPSCQLPQPGSKRAGQRDQQDSWHNLRFFSLIALLLKTTFVAVVTVQWWIRPINTFANWDNLKGLLGDRGTRMQTKLKAWQASKDCWSTEFKECYKIK